MLTFTITVTTKWLTAMSSKFDICDGIGGNSLFSFEWQVCTFSWVLSLLGRYFYNMYLVTLFEIVFSFNVNNIRLSYNISL